jgi:hypothetical protein
VNLLFRGWVCSGASVSNPAAAMAKKKKTHLAAKGKRRGPTTSSLAAMAPKAKPNAFETIAPKRKFDILGRRYATGDTRPTHGWTVSPPMHIAVRGIVWVVVDEERLSGRQDWWRRRRDDAAGCTCVVSTFATPSSSCNQCPLRSATHIAAHMRTFACRLGFLAMVWVGVEPMSRRVYWCDDP